MDKQRQATMTIDGETYTYNPDGFFEEGTNDSQVSTVVATNSNGETFTLSWPIKDILADADSAQFCEYNDADVTVRPA